MELVINISDSVYNTAKRYSKDKQCVKIYEVDDILNAIADGLIITPSEPCIRIPKGAIKVAGKDYITYKRDYLKKWWQPELALLGIDLSNIQPKTDVLGKIKAEIKAISISGHVNEHTAFIRTGDQVKKMALDIIDKYTEERSDKE